MACTRVFPALSGTVGIESGAFYMHVMCSKMVIEKNLAWRYYQGSLLLLLIRRGILKMRVTLDKSIYASQGEICEAAEVNWIFDAEVFTSWFQINQNTIHVWQASISQYRTIFLLNLPKSVAVILYNLVLQALHASFHNTCTFVNVLHKVYVGFLYIIYPNMLSLMWVLWLKFQFALQWITFGQ